MDIREISYGEFREISDLNPRFRPGSRKVKIVLDVHDSEARPVPADLSGIFRKLKNLLPSLEKHQCGEHLFDEAKSDHKRLPEEPLERLADIAHIMEHVIIDLQSKITGMNTCSGITCGHKSPSNRFDLFVECEEKRVGVFSALFAANLLDRLLSERSVSKRYCALVDLARYVYRKDRLQQVASIDVLVSQISLEFGWRRDFVVPLLRILRDFGLMNLAGSLAG